jgi:hypothetical protein
MVMLILTRAGWEDAADCLQQAKAVWTKHGVLTAAELAAHRVAGTDLTTFTTPVDPSDIAAVAAALTTMAEHHPGERLWLEAPSNLLPD